MPPPAPSLSPQRNSSVRAVRQVSRQQIVMTSTGERWGLVRGGKCS